MVLWYYHCLFELVIMFLFIFVPVWFDWAVTGSRPDDEVSPNPRVVLWALINLDVILIGQILITLHTIDHLIETGNSEQIFQQAIQETGRGQVCSFWYLTWNIFHRFPLFSTLKFLPKIDQHFSEASYIVIASVTVL